MSNTKPVRLHTNAEIAKACAAHGWKNIPILDLLTGIRFNVNGSGARSDHYDLTPTTERDAQAMERANGGSLNWVARPQLMFPDTHRIPIGANTFMHHIRIGGANPGPRFPSRNEQPPWTKWGGHKCDYGSNSVGGAGGIDSTNRHARAEANRRANTPRGRGRQARAACHEAYFLANEMFNNGVVPPVVSLPETSLSPVLRQGENQHTEAIRELQTLLNRHGATPALTVDGKHGALTNAALIAFQKINKDLNGRPLAADGVVGPLTWGALRNVPSSIDAADPPPLMPSGEFRGNSMRARVFNAIQKANVKGISDRPEHITAIIGNLECEAGLALCPFQQEVRAKEGIGLMQWSFQRRKDLEAFMWKNGIKQADFVAERNKHLNSVCTDITIHPQALLDRVLEVQIMFMFHELATTWERFYLTFVDHPTDKTGVAGTRAYAELFCCLSLRPGNGGASDSIQDTGVQRALRESDFVGGKGVLNRINYSQLNTRRIRAQTVYELYNENASSPPAYPPTVVAPPPPKFVIPNPMPVLRRSDTDRGSVRVLQEALNKAGIRPLLSIDGGFGPLTEASVRAFQSRERLTVDGVVGPQTWGRLRERV